VRLQSNRRAILHECAQAGVAVTRIGHRPLLAAREIVAAFLVQGGNES
jgi:hypothetical protein